jgi:DNA helicase-2/ATP-dependent DNA helicase PcrA
MEPREYVLRPPAPRVSEPQIDYAAALNPEQLEAVTAKPGPMLVIAGAGSGKTRTLTYRVAYLIEHGIAPENILLLTFTNKAAKEMVGRVASLLPQDTSRMWGGTFHHVGHRILRRQAESLGYRNDFTILDSEDAEDIAAAALRDVGVDPKDKRMPKGGVLLSVFGLAINKEQPFAEVLPMHFEHLVEFQEEIEKAGVRYQERKLKANVMDYDDLLALSLRLLREHQDVKAKCQRKFQHILVDEYQDTSHIQGAFVDLLADEHRQIMVVGDDAQSIYSWRGADFHNILTFPERYSGARVVRIETNYRSTPEILSVANAAIAGNKNQFPKNLRAVRPIDKLPKPALVSVETGNQEALFIAQRILDLYEDGVRLDDIAVLYRSHFHCLDLQLEMTRRNIPFEVTSGLRFFEQAHVKDVAAFLRYAVNPSDEVAFIRCALLLPGIGKGTAEKFWAKLEGGAPFQSLKPPAKAAEAWRQWNEMNRQLRSPELRGRPGDQIQVILDAIYEDHAKSQYANAPARLEDLHQLRAFATQFESTEDFLSQLALLTNVDTSSEKDLRKKDDDGGGKVRLSSVHQSKGLEWKVVFVINLCDGLFPNGRALESEGGEEEERRLFYVAVTRARDELYLSFPRLREMGSGGSERWQDPSRFILEIPTVFLHQWKIVAPGPRYDDW